MTGLGERRRSPFPATGHTASPAARAAARPAVSTRSSPPSAIPSEPLEPSEPVTAPAEPPGAGPLDPLLADPHVTDVLVNGPGEVWVERRGRLIRTSVAFADEEAVRRLAVRLAATAGRRLDAAMPFADVQLRDGTRLHAVLAPIAVQGTCLSLRRTRRRPFTFDELVLAGTMSPAVAGVLHAVLSARLAIVVTGGTGSGKSTLLAALLGAVRPDERIVLVEDTAELVMDRPGMVRLEARPPNIEGAGEVTQRDLVRQALRMRPDRLVLGEVRGPEVLDLLVALNTGHEGGLSTVHANDTSALPTRLEALAALAGLSRPAVHSHIAAALHTAVHLCREADGRRRVCAIGVFRQTDSGLVQVVPALVVPAAPSRNGPALRACDPTPAEGLPILRDLLDVRGVSLPALVDAGSQVRRRA
ncbi:TadA family conjugal transfer-associated ATPase [Frankia sp. B2]|uniref:TadA family conjugal transfer-associated ATPase n=1 Tax=unclassified Frankia TaxID=2632575 RepID=UPI0004617E1B|nr:MULTISPECIES: TadA family conjugal transfer-associated ATPase [unclassified Frankia]KDA43250.1 Flp pilus assembly protein, ATPase CpaF [Frankia sp. BMG5.23]TFE32617.1 TadA family conjugal transfer-associated ATPase [Frankia sp. B2]